MASNTLKIKTGINLQPTTTAASVAGDVRIDSASSNALKYYNGSAEKTVATLGDIVAADLDAGASLDGEVLTSDGAGGVEWGTGVRPALGQQISSASGTISDSPSSYTDAVNQSVTITTTGRPVFIGLISDGSNPSHVGPKSLSVTTSAVCQFQILRDSTAVSIVNFEHVQDDSGSTLTRYYMPPGCIWHIDVPAAGTYTYKLQYKTAVSQVQLFRTKLVAYEL